MRRASSFAILVASLALAGGAATAQDVPRDFVTGEGWFLKQPPSTGPNGKVNFGADGGVKDGNWIGDLVLVDAALGLEVEGLAVTGYLRIGADSSDGKGRVTGTRDICGRARASLFGDVFFRARLVDNGRPDSRDTFRIALAGADGSIVYTAEGSLGNPTPGRGQIGIKKGNRASIPPSAPPDCRVSFEAQPPPPPDTAPPAVTMTSPREADTVSGTVTLSADASDDVGVAGVQFLLDGSPLGAEDTAAPYAVSWDSTTTGDGSHRLAARAHDAAGNTATSGIAVTIANGAPAPTRFEETAATLAPAGAWSETSSAGAGATLSGDRAVFTSTAGATATFDFNGSSVAWIGLPCEICGIARVSVDGTLVATVDTFAPARPAASTAVFTTSGLTAGAHTLRIEVTGSRNPSSGGDIVVVDAFDAEGGGGTGSTRVEENDPSVTYAGTWITQYRSDLSGGSVVESNETNATASLTFSGSGVEWIGFRGPWAGIAKVYLDGTLVATVDTYGPTEQAQTVMYTASGLSPGTHTLRIQVTGTWSAFSTSAWIVVDAFDVASP